jgi:hypothetical protein
LEAIKKERMARPKSDEKTFDITVENADLPQLQPASVQTNSAPTDASLDEDSGADDDSSGKGTSVDPALEEAKHILADYVSLWNNDPALSKTEPVNEQVKPAISKAEEVSHVVK